MEWEHPPTPKQNHQAAKNLFPPPCRVTGLLLNGKHLVPSELIPRCSEPSSCHSLHSHNYPHPGSSFLVMAASAGHSYYKLPTGLTTSGDNPLDHSLRCIARVHSHLIAESQPCHPA